MPANKIFVAGHKGMVGSAIVRHLKKNTSSQIFTATRDEVDLTNQQSVYNFFATNKFDQVYLAAAKVGGIYANNTFPADFLYQNLMIQSNVIESAYQSGVKKLLFLGSSCIYPKLAVQPITEDQLLTGKLEPTNEPYAIAKIAGIKLCESYNRQFDTDFRSVMPTNLYGPGDNYHPENSHVIPGLIRRFAEARSQGLSKVSIWGTGSPYREFLHVDDMASACVHVMNLQKEHYESITEPMLGHLNVGSGSEISIKELALLIARLTDFEGDIEFDSSKPDGTPRKMMDSSKLVSSGWKAATELESGLRETIELFKEHYL